MSDNGFYPVDLFNIPEDAANYLENRGANIARYPGIGGAGYFRANFPNCKRSAGMSGSETIRVFFPNEDEIILFSLAFGHLIQSTRVESIRHLIETERNHCE
jgi:hypothetical protein